MPISLAKIFRKTASVTLNIGEDTVTVVYYPGRVTEKTLIALKTFSMMDEKNVESSLEAFNAMLANLIQFWDVLEDDNVTMFPIDPVRFAELPLAFRVEVLSAILKATSPNKEALVPIQQMRHLN